MRALELDFVARAPKTRHGLLLLLAAMVALFIMFSAFDDLQRDNALLGDELEQIERRAQGKSSVVVSVDEATALEIRAVNAIIDQLALPWESLFRAIESAAFDKIVLVGITPDAGSGTVEVTGEATDREAMIDYVRRLESQPELHGVYLLSHQFDKRGGARPFRFTATASWLDPS